MPSKATTVTCSPPSIAFQVGSAGDAGLCASLAANVDPLVAGGKITIKSWSVVGSPVIETSDLLDIQSFTGTFTVDSAVALNGVISKLTISAAPKSITLVDQGQNTGVFDLAFVRAPIKRQTTTTVEVTNAPQLTNQAAAIGDPHMVGAHGIEFDVFGEPGANYSLVVAPAFEINMQLAAHGPAKRFMTKMTVLFRGKSFTITPWSAQTHAAQLMHHFEQLDATVTIDAAKWRIKIELCPHHTIEFESHHAAHHEALNFLNFRLDVPGCHDAYSGLLGQTYQCKYAKEKFRWSRAQEDAFRVASLETPSDGFSATAECAQEDSYRNRKQ